VTGLVSPGTFPIAIEIVEGVGKEKEEKRKKEWMDGYPSKMKMARVPCPVET
jgi:hypothetical protein